MYKSEGSVVVSPGELPRDSVTYCRRDKMAAESFYFPEGIFHGFNEFRGCPRKFEHADLACRKACVNTREHR